MSDVLISKRADVVALPMQWDAQRLHSGVNFEIIRLTLNSDEVLHLHTNDLPVVFEVLEGIGELKTTDTVHRLTVGDWVEVEAGIRRGWRNTSAFPLVLLVIKKLADKPVITGSGPLL